MKKRLTAKCRFCKKDFSYLPQGRKRFFCTKPCYFKFRFPTESSWRTTGVKKCPHCSVIKNVSDFVFNRASPLRCKECNKTYIDKFRQANYYDTQKIKRQEQKREVMSHYGSKCNCCGEKEIKFLTIDYAYNDGALHRKELKKKGSGTWIYNWLKKNNYPQDSFQALCFNCNLGKNCNNGTCPHKSV